MDCSEMISMASHLGRWSERYPASLHLREEIRGVGREIGLDLYQLVGPEVSELVVGLRFLNGGNTAGDPRSEPGVLHGVSILLELARAETLDDLHVDPEFLLDFAYCRGLRFLADIKFPAWYLPLCPLGRIPMKQQDLAGPLLDNASGQFERLSHTFSPSC